MFNVNALMVGLTKVIKNQLVENVIIDVVLVKIISIHVKLAQTLIEI